MTNSASRIARNDAIANLARATMIDIDDAISALDEICDTIIAAADDIDELDAMTMMHLARMIDPTESHFAAEIRDTIRDNTDHRLA